jgi:ribonuclease-3
METSTDRSEPVSSAQAEGGLKVSKAERKPRTERLEDLEEVLGHRFERKELLTQALTHRSLAWEQSPQERGAGETPRQDNERLEFLGDAVVGLAVAESMYRRFPDQTEGALTRLRGVLVSRRHLAEVARGLGLGRYLLLGRGEERSGGRAKLALLANAMEAVLGAVYLDAGLEAARQAIERLVIEPEAGNLHGQLRTGAGTGDFKSALQEHLQARKLGQPDYRTTAETGPDHRKVFFVEVRVAGETFAGGSGPTRKMAEQKAAQQAMERLREAGEAE